MAWPPLTHEDVRIRIDENDAAVKARIDAAVEDTGWIEITALATGWTSYQVGLGSSWTPRYRRKSGIVYIEGLLNGGPTGLAFTLPAGFRCGTGTTMRHLGTSGGIDRVDINSNGTFTFQSTLVGAATTGWHNIGCSYIQEN